MATVQGDKNVWTTENDDNGNETIRISREFWYFCHFISSKFIIDENQAARAVDISDRINTSLIVG